MINSKQSALSTRKENTILYENNKVQRNHVNSSSCLSVFKLTFMKLPLLVSILSTLQLLVGCWDITTKTPAEQQAHQQELIRSLEIRKTTDASVTDSEDTLQNNEKKHTIENSDTKTKSDSAEKSNNEQDNTLKKQIINNQKEKKQYDITAWKTLVATPLTIDEVSARPDKLATVVSTDNNSLDFSSHEATKYRFMSNDAPYFDLVDSAKFLEVHWYYANQSDTVQEKQISSDHAKRTHRFARQLMGDGGGEVVTNMLFGQVIKNEKVGMVTVTLAKCEFYSCMLVMQKSKDTEKLIDNKNDSGKEENNNENIDVDKATVTTSDARGINNPVKRE